MPAIPPSGFQPTQPRSSNDPVQDVKDYFANLVGNPDYTLNKLGEDIGGTIQSLTTVPDIINAIQNFFNHPSPYYPNVDIYLCYMTEDCLDITSCLNQIISDINPMLGASFTLLPPTLMDNIYSGLSHWPSPSEGINDIASEILESICGTLGNIDSYGTVAQLSQAIASILTDPGLFSYYGPISYSDLQALMTELQQFGPFTIPDFSQYYMQLGFEASPSTMETALLQQMRNVWTTGSTATLLAWAPTLFSDYPGVSITDITTIAQDLGLTLPSSFAATFNAMVALLPADPGSDDYKMIVDFQHQWIAGVFANPNAWNAQTWFDNSYGTPGQATYPPGTVDLYLQYLGADAPTIQSLVDIFYPGATNYTPTAWDTTCRTMYTAHAADTSGIYFDFFKACRAAGSSDANQAIEKWLDQNAIDAFESYPGMTPKDVLSFLNNFSFVNTIAGQQISYICDYVSNYILSIWIPENPSAARFGNQVIAEITAQVSSGAVTSFAELQTYISNRIPVYESQYPSIPPATIEQLFAAFGIVSQIVGVKDYFTQLAGNSDPLLAAIGKAISSAIQGLSTLSAIEAAIQGYISGISGTPLNDIFMAFYAQGLWNVAADLQKINNDLNIEISWKFTMPTPTSMDGLMLTLQNWKASCPADVLPMLNAIMANIGSTLGSNGKLSDLQIFITSLMTDPKFFTKFPNVTLTDLQSLLTQCQYTAALPNYIGLYLTLGNKASPSGLEKALLKEMATIWSSGTTAALQSWLPTGIIPLLGSGIKSADIQTVATELGLTLPAYFSGYFDGIQSLIPGDHTSADYLMLVDFQSKWITAMWPNMSQANLQAWFGTNFGTPGQATYPAGVADLYMQYPMANTATIANMVKVLFPTAAYPLMPWDTTYRTIYAAHGTDTSGLYYDFLAACRTAGSSDANQAIEQWIDQFATESFTKYPKMTPADIMAFLNNFPFQNTIGGVKVSYISDYISNYIQVVWIPQNPTAERFGNQVVAEIEAEVASGSIASFAQLKAYVDKEIPVYENQWKTIPPATITGLFQLFGLYP